MENSTFNNYCNIEKITKYLPNNWKDEAKETNAFRRGRSIKTEEELLMLNMIYLTIGESYGLTSAMMKINEGISINKTATKNRIVNSSKWLKQLSEEMNKSNNFIGAKPEFLGDKNVILVDGSDLCKKGSKGTDYKLHFSFDLFNYKYASSEITTNKEGETLTRYNFKENDIVIGDRAYGTITSIEHTKKCNADYILRLKTNSFNLYNKNKEKIDIKERINDLKSWESKCIECYYMLKKQLQPIKIWVMKKDETEIEKSRKKLDRRGVRQQSKISEESKKMAEYIVLATSLDYTSEQIFELYRARWQIERVFLQFKSILNLGDIPTYNDDSTLAFLYGKLFLATLIECIFQQESFPPAEK